MYALDIFKAAIVFKDLKLSAVSITGYLYTGSKQCTCMQKTPCILEIHPTLKVRLDGQIFPSNSLQKVDGFGIQPLGEGSREKSEFI